MQYSPEINGNDLDELKEICDKRGGLTINASKLLDSSRTEGMDAALREGIMEQWERVEFDIHKLNVTSLHKALQILDRPAVRDDPHCFTSGVPETDKRMCDAQVMFYSASRKYKKWHGWVPKISCDVFTSLLVADVADCEASIQNLIYQLSETITNTYAPHSYNQAKLSLIKGDLQRGIQWSFPVFKAQDQSWWESYLGLECYKQYGTYHYDARSGQHSGLVVAIGYPKIKWEDYPWVNKETSEVIQKTIGQIGANSIKKLKSQEENVDYPDQVEIRIALATGVDNYIITLKNWIGGKRCLIKQYSWVQATEALTYGQVGVLNLPENPQNAKGLMLTVPAEEASMATTTEPWLASLPFTFLTLIHAEKYRSLSVKPSDVQDIVQTPETTWKDRLRMEMIADEHQSYMISSVVVGDSVHTVLTTVVYPFRGTQHLNERRLLTRDIMFHQDYEPPQEEEGEEPQWSEEEGGSEEQQGQWPAQRRTFLTPAGHRPYHHLDLDKYEAWKHGSPIMYHVRLVFGNQDTWLAWAVFYDCRKPGDDGVVRKGSNECQKKTKQFIRIVSEMNKTDPYIDLYEPWIERMGFYQNLIHYENGKRLRKWQELWQGFIRDQINSWYRPEYHGFVSTNTWVLKDNSKWQKIIPDMDRMLRYKEFLMDSVKEIKLKAYTIKIKIQEQIEVIFSDKEEGFKGLKRVEEYHAKAMKKSREKTEELISQGVETIDIDGNMIIGIFRDEMYRGMLECILDVRRKRYDIYKSEFYWYDKYRPYDAATIEKVLLVSQDEEVLAEHKQIASDYVFFLRGVLNNGIYSKGINVESLQSSPAVELPGLGGATGTWTIPNPRQRKAQHDPSRMIQTIGALQSRLADAEARANSAHLLDQVLLLLDTSGGPGRASGRP